MDRRSAIIFLLFALGLVLFLALAANARAFVIPDTGQAACFDGEGQAMACPEAGQACYGQDAQFAGPQPSYTLSADGKTVTDNVTGLMWTKSPDVNGDGLINASDALTWNQALAQAETLNAQTYGGHSDWRLPTIKELYSLIDFRGQDPSGYSGADASVLTPFIDPAYFDFAYGDTAAGERIIDAQYWSATPYVHYVFGGNESAFGVNFADGRIKGYPADADGKRAFARYVRGGQDYGVNRLTDNGDGTVTDTASGLTWQQADSGGGLDWAEALAYAQSLNDRSFAGHSDWRLPNAKELQSLVDYTRSPDTTASAAIDPVFGATAMVNEGGELDWPFYWTGTTHVKYVPGNLPNARPGDSAVYLAFGRALGWMAGPGQARLQAARPPQPGPGSIPTPQADAYTLLDVHGAGAQRSDPKQGDPADFPFGHGPQGDVVRIYNYVRCVRGGS